MHGLAYQPSNMTSNPNPKPFLKMKTCGWFLKLFKVHKSISIESIISTNKAKATMVRAELTTTCTTGIDTQPGLPYC